jgi:ribosomal protein L11 methylase PrmA
MSDTAACKAIPGSFRDPSGFLFIRNGILYRQINNSCREDYDAFMASGLYKDLESAGLCIPHYEETSVEPAQSEKSYKIIRPEAIPFISYPYEWCFSQLKDAALAMLEIQKRAIGFGMSLKDASAYNIQFRKSRPTLIDTLSFEKYREGSPWVAYAQFCRHFLAPLALVSLRDEHLNQLSRIYIDGIPLDLAGSLLPGVTNYKFGLLTHIHLHARYQARFADKAIDARAKGTMNRAALLGLIDSLRSAVSSLAWRPARKGWGSYYSNNTYSAEESVEKARIVSSFLKTAGGKTAWDLGANTGLFSRITAGNGMETVSFDSDMGCVEKNYLECVKENRTNILPLVMDLTNPSPGCGWENNERSSLLERGPADVALALALIHHLAIANNLPLERIAEFFRRICCKLIIEFVPKNDPQAQRLLASRKDIFPDYARQGFEEAFSKYFAIKESVDIKGTGRTLYLMVKG